MPLVWLSRGLSMCTIIHRFTFTCNTGEIISVFAADLGDKKLLAILPQILNRLRNEITRVPAMRALISISSSTLHVDLSVVLDDVITGE
jgi:hypothetical protein